MTNQARCPTCDEHTISPAFLPMMMIARLSSSLEQSCLCRRSLYLLSV